MCHRVKEAEPETVEEEEEEEERTMLNLLEAGEHIVRKKEGEDGPDIKGGLPDALIVHACSLLKPGELAPVVSSNPVSWRLKSPQTR